jgi:hypothetical protein
MGVGAEGLAGGAQARAGVVGSVALAGKAAPSSAYPGQPHFHRRTIFSAGAPGPATVSPSVSHLPMKTSKDVPVFAIGVPSV